MIVRHLLWKEKDGLPAIKHRQEAELAVPQLKVSVGWAEDMETSHKSL